MQIALADDGGKIDPVLTGGGGHLDEPELHLRSDRRMTRQLLGDIEWTDDDHAQRFITEQSPQEVNVDTAYRDVGEQNARLKHNGALRAVATAILSDDASPSAGQQTPSSQRTHLRTAFGFPSVSEAE